MPKPIKIIAYHGTTQRFAFFKTHPSEFEHYCGVGETVLGAAFSESREVAASYPASVPVGTERRVIKAGLTVNKPAKYASLVSLKRAMVKFLGGDVTGHPNWAGSVRGR